MKLLSSCSIIILNSLIVIILTVLLIVLDQCFSSFTCGGTLLNANVSSGTECCDDENGMSVALSGQCHDCKETIMRMHACDYIPIPANPCHV